MLVAKRMDCDLMQLKDGVMQLRNDNPDMALVLGSVVADKPQLMICLGQNRIDSGLDAVAIVRASGKEIQGGGGGQPAYATAGGKNPDGLDRAIALAVEMINER